MKSWSLSPEVFAVNQLSSSLRLVKELSLSLRIALGCAFAVASISIAAGCGGGGGGYGGGGGAMPGPQPSPGPTKPAVHINFFGTNNGSIVTPPFGTVSGFTQRLHAQVLGLSPGQQVVLRNNDTVAHTFNVFSGGYPAPGAVNTNSMPNGGVLGPGFQSGPIAPGASTGVLTVTNTTGNLFIVCGFHFGMGMQDGVVVQVGATPGPQATPNPIPSGGGCHGYGC